MKSFLLNHKTWSTLTALLLSSLLGACAHSKPKGTVILDDEEEREERERSPSLMHCGTERWNVKTLSDPTARTDSFRGKLQKDLSILVDGNQLGSVDENGNLQPASIATLRELRAPDQASFNTLIKSGSSDRLPEEHSIARVPVKILGYKMESDRDLHIVVADPDHFDESSFNPADRESIKQQITLIAESVDPECDGANADPEFYHKIFTSVRTQFESIDTEAPRSGKMKWFSPAKDAVLTGVQFYDFLHGQTGVALNGIELHPILNIEVR